MDITEPTRKLLFQHEVLRAKLELKNHLLESVVRDVYEQTGQVLSLARFRLATMEGRSEESLKPEIADAANLIGEAISRLRKISKNLFPEQEILTDAGFIKIIYEELQMDISDNARILQVSGTPSTFDQDNGVILLAIVLRIISAIKILSVENTLNMKIEYRDTNVLISFHYLGKPIDLGTTGTLHENELSQNLSIHQRLTLVDGSIIRAPADNNNIGYQITVPV